MKSDASQALKELERELATKIQKDWIELHKVIVNKKKEWLEKFDELSALAHQEYGITMGGKAGGYSLTNEEGTFRVSLSPAKKTTFDPNRIADARNLIANYITSISGGASPELLEVVDQAFRINDEGRVDAHGILGLLKLNFQGEIWANAMRAINDAKGDAAYVKYLRAHRLDPEGELPPMPIHLNISKV